MALINESQVLGSGSTDLVLNTRGKIYVRVNDRFYELNFKGGGNEGNTVVNNTTINNPEQDLSPYVTKKYLKAALGEYVTKRNWEDVMQTKEALENAQLDGFTESITPITVNTMQMVVGTQNLQFDFINSLTDATVVPPSLYINESEQLICPRGVIKHYTLFGPESVKPNTSIEYYARWTIQGDDGGDYALLDLEEEDKPYYVYLIVPTTNFNKYTDDYVTEHITEDPKGQYTGNWFASVEPHTIDELEGYAYLLVAIVTGSNAKGRSIGYLNGFTEILPGQITAYVFKTADGDQYLDFLNRNFKIGDDKSYMSWNTTDGLVVKGKISVIGGDLYDELDNLQKQIDDRIQAWFTSDNPNIENPHVLPSPRLDGDIFIEDILWPTTDWTTDSIKKEHLGDLYYITEGDYSGKIFRYIKDSSNSSINFYWIEVVDNALAEAIKISYIARSEAQNAQNSANNLNQHIISSLSDGVLTQSEKTNLENYLKNLQISYGELKRTYDILYQNIFLDTTKRDELKTSFNSLNEIYESLIDSVNNIILQPITEPGTINAELENLNNTFIAAYNNFDLALKSYQEKVIEIQKIINTKIDDNFNNYKYLTESLARSGNTEIKGGLVLTSMIELGSKLSNNFEVTAGINGLTIKPDKNDIAFWAGGDFIDKQYDTILENNHPAKIVLRHDGTGYLANGNISWDKDGYGWVGGDGNNYAIKWSDNGIFLGSGIKITESGQETLATLLEAVTKLQSWFGEDEHGDIYTKNDENGRARGFYTNSFLSAGGKSDTPGTGGGTVTGIKIGDNEPITPVDGILNIPPYPTTTSLGLKALAFKDSLAVSEIVGLQSALSNKQDAATAINTSNYANYALPLSGGTMSNTNLVNNLNADLLDGLHSDSFVRRDGTQGYISHFELENIPKGVTQVGSIGWENYQTYPHAGGMWLTLKGSTSLSSLLILFPAYTLDIEPYLYSSIDGRPWSQEKRLAYTSSNVASSSKWANPRTITLTGSVTGSVSIDGSGDVSLATTTNHTHTFDSLTSKPTTISGYGITDAYTKTEVNNTLSGYLPLSGGFMTGNITWKRDSYGIYFFNGCGIEKWEGYGPALVAEGDSTDFWIRNGKDRAINHLIFHTGNYTSYTVKKDGTGASGTWGINISGNAATVGGIVGSIISAQNTGTGYWKNLGYGSNRNLALGSNYGDLAWRAQNFCADLMFGCNLDTHGFISISYDSPIVSFAGSNNSNASDDNPNWYFKLTGTSGTIYSLNCAPTATKLATPRTIWGQSFNGTANVSGSLSGVTTISASGTITSSDGDFLRSTFGSYGTIFESYNNRMLVLLTKKDDQTGGNNSLRPLIIEQSNGNVYLATTTEKVGIGTTSPSQKLSVNGGSIDIAANVSSVSDTGIFVTNTANSRQIQFIIGASGKMGIYCPHNGWNIYTNTDNTVHLGQQTYCDSNFIATGAITAGTASDSRLKSNIATLCNASSVLRQLRGVGFDWNALATDKSSYFKGHDVGLIAQEVEPLIPSAIGTIWGEYKRLDYSKITPYLVEGWKAHDEEIQRLKTKIKQLEERIYGLEWKKND